MAINAKFLTVPINTIANNTLGPVQFGTVTNPVTITYSSTGASFIVFDQATMASAYTALNSALSPVSGATVLAVPANTQVTLYNVNLSTTWAKSQGAATAGSYFYINN